MNQQYCAVADNVRNTTRLRVPVHVNTRRPHMAYIFVDVSHKTPKFNHSIEWFWTGFVIATALSAVAYAVMQ